jgi:hypothetical protein
MDNEDFFKSDLLTKQITTPEGSNVNSLAVNFVLTLLTRKDSERSRAFIYLKHTWFKPQEEPKKEISSDENRYFEGLPQKITSLNSKISSSQVQQTFKLQILGLLRRFFLYFFTEFKGFHFSL